MSKESKIKFEAIFLPDDPAPRCPSKKGFPDENKAWDYVSECICDSCKKEFSNEPLKSYCSAEWAVEKYIVKE